MTLGLIFNIALSMFVLNISYKIEVTRNMILPTNINKILSELQLYFYKPVYWSQTLQFVFFLSNLSFCDTPPNLQK